MRKRIIGIFLGVVLAAQGTTASQTNKQMAFLVEVQLLPSCAALDCPPWPTPPDILYCFQVGDAYFVGEAQTFLGRPSTEKLASLKGTSVQLVAKKKNIEIKASALKFRLRRLHGITLFTSLGCSQA
jgi:hypothetical protein